MSVGDNIKLWTHTDIMVDLCFAEHNFTCGINISPYTSEFIWNATWA